MTETTDRFFHNARRPYLGPREVAKTLSSVSSVSRESIPAMPPRLVLWKQDSDYRVQLLYREQVLTPDCEIKHPLHHIAVQSLKNFGSWDSDSQAFMLNPDSDLDFLFYCFSLFPSTIWRDSGENLRIIQEPIDAYVEIDWQKTGAYLSIRWKVQDPKMVDELVGHSPTWMRIGNNFQPLSDSARQLAVLFSRSERLFLSFHSLAPLLEQYPFEKEVVTEKNEDMRPEIRYVPATPVLKLALKKTSEFPELEAILELKHKSNDEKKRIIYVPEQWDSAEIEETLSRIGFTHRSTSGKFIASDDKCLDILDPHPDFRKLFPKDWDIQGLEEAQAQVKFAQLSINVALRRVQHSAEDADFMCDLTLEQNNARVPLSSLFKNARGQQKNWVKLDSGSFARAPGGGFPRLRSLINLNESSLQMSSNLSVPISSAQAVGMANLESDNLHFDLDADAQRLIERIKDFDRLREIEIPQDFSGTLRDYQRKGLSWLCFLKEFRFGGILADEMGLGKTVQTLAFLQHIVDNDTSPRGPNLIISPTSVVTNWFYECLKFTPKLKALILHGPERKQFFYDLESYDLILTTYPLARIDRHQLRRINWNYLILDEAQYIKNPSASTTRAVKSLPAQHRLALTGTPTENRPLELWSLMDFLMPGYLGTHEYFRNHIERAILEGGGQSDLLHLLKAKITPFVLRRTKAEVESDLPPKIESEVRVSMTPSQQELYNEILMEVRPKVFEEVDRKGIRASSVSILAALLRLRQICNHPRSIEAFKDSAEYDSGKFQLFQSLVQEALENGRKILVFSQFRGMLGIIRDWLDSLSCNYLYLDGSTKNRQSLIDQFNQDENCRLFLISLKAGGTGLNLTAADTVLLYDPWWNPAVENQAIDRAHRIGQQKAVNVYRLVTEGSIEQHIFKLKEVKSELFDCLISEGGARALNLTRQDLEELFSAQPPPADGEL
jgi:non-specific serine/threonine protein kinase